MRVGQGNQQHPVVPPRESATFVKSNLTEGSVEEKNAAALEQQLKDELLIIDQIGDPPSAKTIAVGSRNKARTSELDNDQRMTSQTALKKDEQHSEEELRDELGADQSRQAPTPHSPNAGLLPGGLIEVNQAIQ